MFRVVSHDEGRLVWDCNEDHILVLKNTTRPWVMNSNTSGVPSWRIQYWATEPGSTPGSEVPVQRDLEENGAVMMFASHEAAEEFLSRIHDWQPLVFECTVR